MKTTILLLLSLLLLNTSAYALDIDDCCASYPSNCNKSYNSAKKSLETVCSIPVSTELTDSKSLEDVWRDVISLYESNQKNWDRLYSKLLELNEFFKLNKDVTKLNTIKSAMVQQIQARQAIVDFIDAKLVE